MRALIALVLCAVVAATSGAMAVARGQSGATGQLVLCWSGGPVVVPVDAQGNPTGPAHFCPDLVLGLLAAVALPPAGARRPDARLLALVPHEPARHPAPVAAPAPAARGPPHLG